MGRNLGLVEVSSTALVNKLLDIVSERRRSLVQDMRNGHIWDRRIIGLADELDCHRPSIDDALGGPDAKRAYEVGELLRHRAVASKIWPKLRVVVTADGAPIEHAVARLQPHLGDDIKVHAPFYTASEGLLGVNVLPQRPFGVTTFVLDPGSMVFELLPLEWRNVDAPPYDATL